MIYVWRCEERKTKKKDIEILKKNAENFSTKAFAIEVVLFAI